MALGPGKYDHLTTYIRRKTNARAVAIVIVDGNRGSGFDCQMAGASPEEAAELTPVVALAFRSAADQLEQSVEQMLDPDAPPGTITKDDIPDDPDLP